MKEFYHPGNGGQGRRKMTQEARLGTSGKEEVLLVPAELLPLERTILTFLAFSQERQLTGGEIGRKVGYKGKTPGKIHKTLKRLRSWDYMNREIKGYVEEPFGFGIVRHLNFITERGMERLREDYES